MTARIYPVDAVAGSPSYTGRALRQVMSTLVAGTSVARPFGGISGVPMGTSTATVTASSSTWTVKPHAGFIDAESSSSAGGYWYAFDANVTGSMTAANATNPRIDLISVQISDPAESDGTSAPGAAIVYTVGTAASSPARPASPVRSLDLATISVPASGGGAPTVTWVGTWMSALGGILIAAGSGFYPASPYQGQFVYDTNIDSLLKWDGSNWTHTTRAPYYRQATFSFNVPNSSFTQITSLSTVQELKDTTANPWSTGTYTAPAYDYYSFWVYTQGVTSAARTSVRITQNGNEVGGNDTGNGATGRVSASAVNIWLAPGDTVQFYLYQNSGGSATMAGNLTVRRG